MNGKVKWHTLASDEIMNMLKTSLEGLDVDEAKLRLEKYGLNVLKERRKVTAWQLFIGQFTNFLVLLLIVAAVVSGVIGEIIDSIAITAIIILNATLGFVQEYRAENALEALKKLATP
ncbi:MAG: cation-transporting P-type ATPase, partial [archaeon GB-1867-097]|nr:cation-transporting P-type ATPase [Candidatus Culexmicrobium thermophilum]